MGRILRLGSLQLCQSLVNGLYNKGHSEVQIICFHKIPVVLSKCGAIAKESTSKIVEVRGF